MREKKFLGDVNRDRREFLEKATKGAFVIPTVISIMMLDQKLNVTAANAQSDQVPCLSGETLISTPYGDIKVVDLRPGMKVYTLDDDGRKVIDQIELVSKVTVPRTHILYNLQLSDGRGLLVSGAHPMGDGSVIQRLRAGTTFDGAEVQSIDQISYTAGYTYDLLPAGDTGYYWAGGVLLASTLAPESQRRIRKAS